MGIYTSGRRYLFYTAPDETKKAPASIWKTGATYCFILFSLVLQHRRHFLAGDEALETEAASVFITHPF